MVPIILILHSISSQAGPHRNSLPVLMGQLIQSLLQTGTVQDIYLTTKSMRSRWLQPQLVQSKCLGRPWLDLPQSFRPQLSLWTTIITLSITTSLGWLRQARAFTNSKQNSLTRSNLEHLVPSRMLLRLTEESLYQSEPEPTWTSMKNLLSRLCWCTISNQGRMGRAPPQIWMSTCRAGGPKLQRHLQLQQFLPRTMRLHTVEWQSREQALPTQLG